MDNEPDVEMYNKVINMVGQGRAMISQERIDWNEQRGNYAVFLRWVELFLEIPEPTRQ
jgi:hypothetical protein